MTKFGQKLQTDFPVNYIKNMQPANRTALSQNHRFSKWLAVWVCESTQTTEANIFLESFNIRNGAPQKLKSDKRSDFITKGFCGTKQSSILSTENRNRVKSTDATQSAAVVKFAIQPMENMIFYTLEKKISFKKSNNRTMRIMRFSKHTVFEVGPSELHQSRNTRTFSTVEAIPDLCGTQWKGRIDWSRLGQKKKFIIDRLTR